VPGHAVNIDLALGETRGQAPAIGAPGQGGLVAIHRDLRLGAEQVAGRLHVDDAAGGAGAEHLEERPAPDLRVAAAELRPARARGPLHDRPTAGRLPDGNAADRLGGDAPAVRTEEEPCPRLIGPPGAPVLSLGREDLRAPGHVPDADLSRPLTVRGRGGDLPSVLPPLQA